jgi:predicted MPP superfamily phosphohydrolase
MANRVWNFNPEAEWFASWENHHCGTYGELQYCLDCTEPYREEDTKSLYRSKSEVIDVLAQFGEASGNWWSISFVQ